jgi:hypothetical protein
MPAVTQDQRPSSSPAQSVEDEGLEERAEGSGPKHRCEPRQVPARGQEAGERKDQLREDRRE